MPDPKKLLLLALDVTDVIRAVLARLRDAEKGKVDPDVVRAELAKFRSGLAANDADADAELLKRFGG